MNVVTEDETIIIIIFFLEFFTVSQILSWLLTNCWKAVWLHQTPFIIDNLRLRIMQNFPLVELFPFWIQQGIAFNVLRGLVFSFVFLWFMWRIRERNSGRWDSLWLDFFNEWDAGELYNHYLTFVAKPRMKFQNASLLFLLNFILGLSL